VEREVEVTREACAQGTFFGFPRESTMAVAEAQGFVYFSGVVLVWWCFIMCLWWLQFV
jgi:hypothetical protein